MKNKNAQTKTDAPLSAVENLTDVEKVLRELSSQIIHPKENVFKTQADKIAAALLQIQKLAGYARTVRLDRRQIVDETTMCLQTESWCVGLVDIANRATLTTE